MREFFHGWRRKAGVVTLAMALAMMGVWVRSLSVGDVVHMVLGARFQTLGARHGFISGWSRESMPGEPRFRWVILPPEVFAPDDADVDTIYLWEIDGPHWRVAIAPIAIPLALLSAYLLLIPSRKRPPRPNDPHV